MKKYQSANSSSTAAAPGRVDDSKQAAEKEVLYRSTEEGGTMLEVSGGSQNCITCLLLPMGGCAVNRRRLAASTTKKHSLTLLAVVVLLLVTAVILCTITIKGVMFSEMGPPRPAAAFATHQHEEEPAARDRHADSSTDVLPAGPLKMVASDSQHPHYHKGKLDDMEDKPRKNLIEDYVGQDASISTFTTTSSSFAGREKDMPNAIKKTLTDVSRELQTEGIDCVLSQEASFVFSILVKLNHPQEEGCMGSTGATTANSTLSLLTENDKEKLKILLLTSFSTLAERYCDPYLRNVTSVDILRTGVSPSSPAQSQEGGGSSLTLEVRVLGTLRCRESELGCNLAKIGLFDSPVELDPQQREPTCLCRPTLGANNTVLIATDRGPTEAEFMEHFGMRLATVAPSLDCPGLQAADCGFGTIFQTALAVTFADADAARNASDLIGVEALGALNELYTPDDPSICYPEFRVFDSVSVVFQEARRQLQDMPIPNASPGANVSVPTSLANGTEPSPIVNVTSAPSTSPSSIDDAPSSPQPLTAILYIGGVCSQCGGQLFFQNDISTRRRLKASFQDAMEDRPGGRTLQAINATSTKSNCFCPIDSVVAEVPGPGIEEFESTLAERLQIEITQTQQVDPESIVVVNDGDSFVNNGIYQYPCTDISSTFKKNVTLELQVPCGSAPELSDEDKNKIGFVYANAYNSLRTAVCDPFNLEVTSAKVVETGDLRAGGSSSSLPLRIEVTVVCNGCDPLATDVYGFPEVFLEEETTKINETRRHLYSTDELKTRRLQEIDEEGTSCTCNSTLPRRAPLEADVTDAFDLISVQEQDLLPACIGNTTTCDFGKTFTTSALFEVQGTLDPLETASILEQAFTNALDRLIGGGNATVCNSLFGLVSDTEVYLDFVYNSVDRNANDTTRRQLQDPLPTLAPTSDSTLTFWLASGSNITNTPTTAPTVPIVSETDFFLLDAFGLCNGCPAELVFSNAATEGRRRIDQISTGDKISSTSITQFRFLQGITAEEPESECYCPIGSVQVVTDFAQISLLEIIQQEVAKISSNLTVTGTVSGLTRVDCVEETPFSTTIDYRFSAFEWVVNTPNDVQGLGDAIANIYNGLVEEFCDEFFRNSISLTYVAGSLQRSSGTGRRHDRDLQNMQGCFNYRATFTVTGLCRGCQALGTPIPLFGNSTTNRKLDEIATRMPSNLSRQRHLQEAGSTCICDSTSLSQRDAPSRAAIRAGLETLIPDQLPWAQNPSICGLPVDTEIPCPAIPAGPSTTITMRFYARRSDGGCLQAADLQQMATQFANTFNSNMKLGHFPCEPQYLQVSNVIIDPSTLSGCRRELLRGSKNNDGETQDSKTSRELLQDYEGVLASMTVTGNIYAINVDAILASESTTLATAAASITEKSGGLYDIETGSATKTPSAMPSAFPSGFPSAFPSETPTSSPSESPSVIPPCSLHSQFCSGTVEEVLTWCGLFAGTGDECCAGTDACLWVDQATIFRGSCNGDYACEFGSTALGTITVGANSCTGQQACRKIEAISSIVIGSNSCKEQYACEYIGDIGAHGGETISVSIGDGSCHEDRACNFIGDYLATTVTVGDGSCIGPYACWDIGGYVATAVTIGSGSCAGQYSCNAVGENEATTVTIDTKSCIGDYACLKVGKALATSVTISKSTCTAKACSNVDYPICGGDDHSDPPLYQDLANEVTCAGCTCSSPP